MKSKVGILLLAAALTSYSEQTNGVVHAVSLQNHNLNHVRADNEKKHKKSKESKKSNKQVS